MISPSIGIVELIVSFVMVVFTIAIPVGILILLYLAYKKLGNIEELLKKNKEDQ